MTGLMIGLVICLTTVTLASLAGLVTLIWWTMSSSGQHSTSAAKSQREAMAAMRETIAQSAEILRLQMELTETLLLGRPVTETPQQLEPVRPSETSPTPEELWERLPDGIKGTLQREHDEASTWPTASEQLQGESDEDQWRSLQESLTRSPSLT